jgi:caa(3)-type oxidase subunit IV
MSTHSTTLAQIEAHDDHDAHHAKIYLAVLVMLLILTGITVGASYIDLGPLNIVVALLIATTKASLVGLFFMHLLYDRPINAMALVSGFMFLGLLLSFCLLDIDNRGHEAPTNKSVPKASGIMPPEPVVPGAAAPAEKH